MKKISVVLPVFNGEKFLAGAIESILHQTWKNFQLIIVDDCSTDSTPYIIQKYASKDSRIVAVKNENNLKLPKSLNIGFQLADGEYFTWTSDDNLYRKNAFEILADYLDNNENCAMVYADMFLVNSEGNLTKGRRLEPELLLYNNIIGACFLYRKEIAKIIGDYDENLFLAEDYDYWLRIHQVGNIIHHKRYLYYYRFHENSLTITKHNKVRLQTGKVLDKHFQYITKQFSSRKALYKFFDIYVYYKGSNGKEVLEQFKKKYKTYSLYRITVRGLYFVKKNILTMSRKIYRKIK